MRILAFILLFTATWNFIQSQDIQPRQLFAEPNDGALNIDVTKKLNPVLTNVDEFVSNMCSGNFSSYENLVEFLKQQFSDQKCLARSIYTWVALNISYDQKSVVIPEKSEQSAVFVWMSRSAVCEGYANLFAEMCQAAGIESRVINGYVKEFAGGDLNFPNHAWNSVKINGKWELLDVTWASVNNEGMMRSNPDMSRDYIFHKLDHFFMVNPNRMIFTHLPEDPLWQLHDNYIDLKAFLEGEKTIKSVLRNSVSEIKDFELLIAEFEELDSLDKSIAFLERMERNSNNKVREYSLGIAYYYKAQKILKAQNKFDKYEAARQAKVYFKKSLEQLAILDENDIGFEFSKDLAKNVAFRIETIE